MASATTVQTYSSPIKFDVEIVVGAIIAGVILGFIDRTIGKNKIVQFIIGAVMFIFGPSSSYASFIKLSGVTLMSDAIYSLLKQNVKVQVS